MTDWPDLLLGVVVDEELSGEESTFCVFVVSDDCEVEESKTSALFVGRPIECVSSLDVALGFSCPHATTNNVALAITPIAQCFTRSN